MQTIHKYTFYFSVDIIQKEKRLLPHIIVGDFNALKRSDYTQKQWNNITKVRAQNKWEKPQDFLIEHITKDLNCIFTGEYFIIIFDNEKDIDCITINKLDPIIPTSR
jgi:hypothetical protein